MCILRLYSLSRHIPTETGTSVNNKKWFEDVLKYAIKKNEKRKKDKKTFHATDGFMEHIKTYAESKRGTFRKATNDPE